MKKIFNGLARLDRGVGKLEDLLCCTLLVVMSIIIFVQIICRTAKFPLVWSEELSRFMFIWLIYISVCITTRRESHLSVDILPLVVKGRGQIVVKLISNVLCFCFFLFVLYYGIGVLHKLAVRRQVSAAMQMNMFWAYLGPYAGAGLACLHYIILILRDLLELAGLNGNEEGGAAQ